MPPGVGLTPLWAALALWLNPVARSGSILKGVGITVASNWYGSGSTGAGGSGFRRITLRSPTSGRFG